MHDASAIDSNTALAIKIGKMKEGARDARQIFGVEPGPLANLGWWYDLVKWAGVGKHVRNWGIGKQQHMHPKIKRCGAWSIFSLDFNYFFLPDVAYPSG